MTLVALGIVAAVAGSPFDRFFLAHFSFYWGLQALVLVLLLPFRPRPAAVAGTAFALALHFVAFYAWMQTRPPGQALGWLFYLFSFPGSLAGAVSAALLARRRPRFSAVRVGVVATANTMVGIALNHWATVLTGGFGL